MSSSIFSTIGLYLRDVYLGLRSLLGACFTALPYLLSVRSGDLRKEVTEQYPDPVSSRRPDDLSPRFRGLLHNDIERCTGCQECELVCPVQCITVKNEAGPEPKKNWVSVFDIDFSKCTFCGLCVESCEPASLIHTKEYELAADRPDQLVKSFGRGVVTPEQREKWAALREARELEDYE